MRAKILFLFFLKIIPQIQILSQSTKNTIFESPLDQIEFIRYKWLENEIYTFQKTTFNSKIQNNDTLSSNFTTDTFSFRIIKNDVNSTDVILNISLDKFKEYIISSSCKTNYKSSISDQIHIELSYNYKDQEFRLLNCDSVKQHAKKILNYSYDCKYEDEFDKRIDDKIKEFIEDCDVLRNWFSIDLQFLFIYDGASFPKLDSIKYIEETITKSERLKEKQNNEDQNNKDQYENFDKINRVYFICSKINLQNSNTKYILKEDLNFGLSFSKRFNLEMLDGFKDMIPVLRYENEISRIHSKEENNYEEILISKNKEILELNKIIDEKEKKEDDKISNFFNLKFRRIE